MRQTTSELKKTTTEMKEEAGKISEKLTSVETKVNSDKAGGRNLLLQSNVKYEKTDYLINQYSLTENFFADEVYTFVIKGVSRKVRNLESVRMAGPTMLDMQQVFMVME